MRSERNDAWEHLETLQSNFLRSGYPLEVVKNNILHGIKSLEEKHVSRTPANSQSSHVLKIPYVDEGSTRLVRKNLTNAALVYRM